MKQRFSPRRGHSRPGARSLIPVAILAVLAVGAGLLLAGCGRAAATEKTGAGGPAPRDAKAPEVSPVQLTADRERYAPGEPMRLRVRNAGGEEVQLSGGLGGLRGWRLAGGQREPWQHGMMETSALVPVPPGQSVELGPVPAPERPGRYLLEVTYFAGSGKATASTTIEVTGS